MMFLEKYYTENKDNILFSRQQASGFAKEIADDFNPLHDVDAKLFCVPGDLLFAVVLAKYGLNQKMRFVFSGMVGDGTALHLPETSANTLNIRDDNEKQYLSVERDGENTRNQELISNLTRNYVRFSGHTFPDILVPLMSDNNVMINPGRPLVIYESMEINLQRLDVEDPQLKFTHSVLEAKGKKASVRLEFSLNASGEEIGTGTKYMSLRGLREFEAGIVKQMVDQYSTHKQDYFAK